MNILNEPMYNMSYNTLSPTLYQMLVLLQKHHNH